MVKTGGQRIYHVTHLSNLAGIVESERLVADLGEETSPTVDISSSEHRERRRAADVTVVDYLGRNAVSIAEYVPFALTPDPSFWMSLRSGEADDRLAAGVRGVPASEFVVLVSTVDKADAASTVLARGDAAHPLTRFVTTPEACARELRGVLDDDETLAEAELLVRNFFPLTGITLVGVANEKTRDEVKAMLHSAGHGAKVAVYPPWFAAAE